jgi:hypothetical protein
MQIKDRIRITLLQIHLQIIMPADRHPIIRYERVVVPRLVPGKLSQRIRPRPRTAPRDDTRPQPSPLCITNAPPHAPRPRDRQLFATRPIRAVRVRVRRHAFPRPRRRRDDIRDVRAGRPLPLWGRGWGRASLRDGRDAGGDGRAGGGRPSCGRARAARSEARFVALAFGAVGAHAEVRIGRARARAALRRITCVRGRGRAQPLHLGSTRRVAAGW